MTDEERVRRLVDRRMRKSASALRGGRVLLDAGLPDDSISRSYYAMFHAASALLMVLGFGSSKHRGILSLFDREVVRPGKVPRELSRWIHDAFEARQEADYADQGGDVLSVAESTLTNAQQFVSQIRSAIEKALPGPDSSSAHDS